MPTPTVLVLDDDNDNVEILEAALASHDFETTTAGSCAQARELLEQTRFDALVTDFSLGDGDAIALLTGLGDARPRVAILVTGYGSPEDRARSLAAGFAAHLVKPIAVDQLVAALKKGLAPA